MKLRLNIRSSIFLFSALLLFLLIWLSISFLLFAKKELHNANHQQLHLDSDSSLRSAMLAIADERAEFHWLSGVDGLLSIEHSLIRYYKDTDSKITASLNTVREALENDTYSAQLLFERHEILGLILALEVKLNDLADVRQIIARDLNLPVSERSPSLHITAFDYFSEIIEQLELVRNGAQYSSINQHRNTRNNKVLSDTIWKNISLNKTLSAYIEGYLTSNDIRVDSIKSRSSQIFRELEINFRNIDLINSHSNLDEKLDGSISNYIDWHRTFYQDPVKHVIENLSQDKSAPFSGTKWREITYHFDQHNQGILDKISSLYGAEIQYDKARANRNLNIDYILVVFCFLSILCTFWIVKRVHHDSTHDELTDIPNRHLFDSLGREAVDSRFSKGSQYCFLRVELCNFRYINDHFGQVVGDKTLLTLVSRMQENLDDNSLLGQVGTQEFSLLIPYNDQASLQQKITNIHAALSSKFNIDGFNVHLDSSMGYACSPEDGENYDDLRKAAHLALYTVQQSGTGNIGAYKPIMAIDFQERQRIELDLLPALENNEFELYYQPQIDVERHCVSGVEALIRWNHPELGFIRPDRFISIAEGAGLLPSIGQWVINESARQSRTWLNDFELSLRMSVNVSIHQFLVGDIVEIVAAAINRYGLHPESYEIEITESVAMADHELVKSKLDSLRKLGVLTALDDFGTGYSSLSYLQKLSFDTLKIDRSFINNLDGGTRNEKILVESIATMANRLEFHIVAEGVENERQVHEVERLGIHTIQGYFFSKPVPGCDIPDVVNDINAQLRGSTPKAA